MSVNRVAASAQQESNSRELAVLFFDTHLKNRIKAAWALAAKNGSKNIFSRFYSASKILSIRRSIIKDCEKINLDHSVHQEKKAYKTIASKIVKLTKNLVAGPSFTRAKSLQETEGHIIAEIKPLEKYYTAFEKQLESVKAQLEPIVQTSINIGNLREREVAELLGVSIRSSSYRSYIAQVADTACHQAISSLDDEDLALEDKVVSQEDRESAIKNRVKILVSTDPIAKLSGSIIPSLFQRLISPLKLQKNEESIKKEITRAVDEYLFGIQKRARQALSMINMEITALANEEGRHLKDLKGIEVDLIAGHIEKENAKIVRELNLLNRQLADQQYMKIIADCKLGRKTREETIKLVLELLKDQKYIQDVPKEINSTTLTALRKDPKVAYCLDHAELNTKKSLKQEQEELLELVSQYQNSIEKRHNVLLGWKEEITSVSIPQLQETLKKLTTQVEASIEFYKKNGIQFLESEKEIFSELEKLKAMQKACATYESNAKIISKGRLESVEKEIERLSSLIRANQEKRNKLYGHLDKIRKTGL